MPKDEEHIINWILNTTSEKRQRAVLREKKRPYKKNKRKIDNMIYYCNKCKNSWCDSSRWLDSGTYKKYPKGMMPSIGKKRLICPECNN